MNAVSFALVLHAHQPIGNFDHVIEASYKNSYLPFLDCLERHPAILVNLHYSGVLLEWIEQHHPEYLGRLRKLREAGRIELIGGGFYEPILISIPEADRLAQITRLRDYIKNHFGESPRGFWLTERIWEPDLPEILAKAEVKYTLADDTHFLNAGVDPENMYGYYATESNGCLVNVIPGLKSLRYLIPWRPVQEVITALAGMANAHPHGLITMGDDLEKFGSWPQTYRSVYEEHWLDDFFSALESSRAWLRCTRASDYLASHAPLGRVYLPTASYREMMEWWLPYQAAEIYEEAANRFQAQDEKFLRFLNGGTWRNFLNKYSESNLIHKQMLALSKRFQAVKGAAPAAEKKAIYAHLLAAQCNDAYWHGVFGGLYAPHLRHAIYSHLISAESAIDQMEKSFENGPVLSKHFDLTLCGRPELAVRSPRLNLLIRPSDGATVAAIHYKPASVNLVNSLRRRPEIYHKKVAQAMAARQGGETRSIHDRLAAKQPGLNEYLIYDRYERAAFRNYLFSPEKAFDSFPAIQMEESQEWARAEYAMAESSANEWLFVRSGPLKMGQADMQLLIEKHFRAEQVQECDRLVCSLRLKCFQGAGRFRMGMELVLNLLAGNAPDRYYTSDGWKEVLEWRGERPGGAPLALTDEWLKLSMSLTPNPPGSAWWLSPIFTVSQSEDGFEKVYQGSQIMPVWDIELKESENWEGSVEMMIQRLP